MTDTEYGLTNRLLFSLISLAILLFFYFAYFGISLGLIPQFEASFKSFNADLNVYTNLLLKYKFYLPLPLMLCVFHLKKFMIIGIGDAQYRKKYWDLVKINFMILIVMLVLVMIGMYLPALNMSTVV